MNIIINTTTATIITLSFLLSIISNMNFIVAIFTTTLWKHVYIIKTMSSRSKPSGKHDYHNYISLQELLTSYIMLILILNFLLKINPTSCLAWCHRNFGAKYYSVLSTLYRFYFDYTYWTFVVLVCLHLITLWYAVLNLRQNFPLLYILYCDCKFWV